MNWVDTKKGLVHLTENTKKKRKMNTGTGMTANIFIIKKGEVAE